MNKLPHFCFVFNTWSFIFFLMVLWISQVQNCEKHVWCRSSQSYFVGHVHKVAMIKQLFSCPDLYTLYTYACGNNIISIMCRSCWDRAVISWYLICFLKHDLQSHFSFMKDPCTQQRTYRTYRAFSSDCSNIDGVSIKLSYDYLTVIIRTNFIILLII